MGSGNSPTPVTTTMQQSKDPWEPSQTYLKEGMLAAQDYFRRNVGYKPYPTSTLADMDPTLARGIAEQKQIAERSIGGIPGINAAGGLANELIQNKGLTPGLNKELGRYDTLYNEASSQQNPFLQAMLNTSNRTISDKVNASMSGAGRYGSGAHTDVATRAMAEAADPILAQDYARRQQQRMAAAGAGTDIYSQGLDRSGQWAETLPKLDAAKYAPAERLSLIGQMYTDRNQGELNDAIKRWNAQQAQQWENLQRYTAITGGAGALGGTTMGTMTQPGAAQPSTLQRLFGGASAGAGIGSMFGGPGAAVGAAGGGLLGLLG